MMTSQHDSQTMSNIAIINIVNMIVKQSKELTLEAEADRQVGGFASFRCRGGKQLVPLLQALVTLLVDVLSAQWTKEIHGDICSL